MWYRMVFGVVYHMQVSRNRLHHSSVVHTGSHIAIGHVRGRAHESLANPPCRTHHCVVTYRCITRRQQALHSNDRALVPQLDHLRSPISEPEKPRLQCVASSAPSPQPWCMATHYRETSIAVCGPTMAPHCRETSIAGGAPPPMPRNLDCTGGGGGMGWAVGGSLTRGCVTSLLARNSRPGLSGPRSCRTR